MTIEQWSGSGSITYEPRVSKITGDYAAILAAIAHHRIGELIHQRDAAHQQQLTEALFDLEKRKLVVRTFCGGEFTVVSFAYGLTPDGQDAYERLIKPNM